MNTDKKFEMLKVFQDANKAAKERMQRRDAVYGHISASASRNKRAVTTDKQSVTVSNKIKATA